MSRKPFSEVTESYFRNEMREPLVRGHDNRSAACLLANAAIAQDHAEYKALRDTLCITERDLDRAINDRDTIKDERDALREENEKLREQCDRYDHIIPSMAKGRNDFRSALKKTRAQLAEAVKVLDGLVKHCAEAHYEDCSIMYDLDEEKCDCGSGAAHDKARDFLAKAKT